MVVVSWVVSTVQRVGVPGTIQALDPSPSLSPTLTSVAGGGGGGVVHCTVFQDGLGGSAGFGWVVRGTGIDYFSFSTWWCTTRCSHWSQWSQWWSAPFQL